jgi:hypothetical protein
MHFPFKGYPSLMEVVVVDDAAAAVGVPVETDQVFPAPGSAAGETGPGLLGPPLACGVRFFPLDPFHGLTKSETGSRR